MSLDMKGPKMNVTGVAIDDDVSLRSDDGAKNLGFGNTAVVHWRYRRRQYPKVT